MSKEHGVADSSINIIWKLNPPGNPYFDIPAPVCAWKLLIMLITSSTIDYHDNGQLWLMIVSNRMDQGLSYWGRVTHICVIEMGHHWFMQWLVAFSAPSHYLNQWWLMVNWTLGNKVQWNFYQNWNIFIDKIAFENVVCQSGGHLVPASVC